MAADPERPPYPNGTAGRPTGAEEDGPATKASRRSGSEDDVAELPDSATVKSSSQTPPVPKHPSDSPTISGPTSTTSFTSPETSPTRHSLRAPSSNSASRIPSQSRKESGSRSPARSASGRSDRRTFSPAPAVQRAAAHIDKPPILNPSPNPEPVDVLTPDKSIMPIWAASRRSDQDSAIPNTSSKRSPAPPDDSTKGDRSAPRNVNRGLNGTVPALETVQEASSDLSTASTDTAVHQLPPEEPRLPKIDEDAIPRSLGPTPESGSESGGNKSSGVVDETKAQALSVTKPGRTITTKRSSTSLSGTHGKPTDPPVHNMTVETETVSTIPQVSVGVASGDRSSAGRPDQGTVRVKQSMETIRPKREKRKARRPATLTSGAASSKADIFEAKVASAVDEADVSDSDETFVYESNPPDPYPGRPPRYHSRTPSATSMASQADQFASRNRSGLRDSSHSVTGKRSMKFTNNTYNSSVDGEAGDDGSRHTRADSGALTPRRHHIGRYGRNAMNPSLFEGDSGLPQSQPALKSPKHFIGSGFRHSRNTAQRTVPNYRTISNPKKMDDAYGFDYDAEGADDERTPLVRSPHLPRSRHGRRPNSASLRQMEYMQRRQKNCFSRYGTSALVGLLVLLAIGGATAFIIAVTKPLVDVKVVAIQNVLASEQELMLDLNVQAINPNLFPVVVDDMDVNIFARSRYVGTDSLWREHGSDTNHLPRVETSRKRARLSHLVRCLGSVSCLADAMSSTPVHSKDGVDRGTDPIEPDPAGDAQTMLLGRVFRFDSPLAFEPSPWNYQSSRSKGQIRLARPGNKTEEGGTERWERVLQHPFELIVRGVIKYQLSMTSRLYSASVSSSTKVVPQHGGGDNDDGDGDQDPHKNDTVVSRRRQYMTPRLAITAAASPEPTRNSTLLIRTFTA